MSRLGILVLSIVTAGTLQAQQPAQCTAPRYSDFDFWLGQWKVRWQDPKGAWQHGTNRIEKTLDGCVVLERFDGTPGTPLTGLSISTYDRREGKWKQTWVDNTGSYLDFVGERNNDTMTLARSFREAGATVHQRMLFSAIKRDSLTWEWQRSDDEGKTWATRWRIEYERLSPEPPRSGKN